MLPVANQNEPPSTPPTISTYGAFSGRLRNTTLFCRMGIARHPLDPLEKGNLTLKGRRVRYETQVRAMTLTISALTYAAYGWKLSLFSSSAKSLTPFTTKAVGRGSAQSAAAAKTA
jgi:hypothetical protein